MEVKNIQDYYEQIYKKYPTIPKSDIKRILQYGWKQFYLHNSYGGDVLLQKGKFWLYCGNLMKDSVKFFNYYRKKMCVKIRTTFRLKKLPWDGYYYFGRTREQYEQYLNQKNKKGRPKKNFKFEKVMFYKLYDECNLMNCGCVAIFRIPAKADFGMMWYKAELVIENPECVLVREPLKFNDILLSVCDYQFITDRARKYKKRKNVES